MEDRKKNIVKEEECKGEGTEKEYGEGRGEGKRENRKSID